MRQEAGEIGRVEIAARGDGDGLTCTLNAGGVERIEMKKLGGQLRGESWGVVERGVRGQLGRFEGEGFGGGESRLGDCPVERGQTLDERGKSGGGGNVGGENYPGSGRGGGA